MDSFVVERGRRCSSLGFIAALLVLSAAGCGIPAEEDAQTVEPAEAAAITLPECKSLCSRSGSCSAGCSVKDSQGSVATTCEIYMSGQCENRDQLDPNAGGGNSPAGGGGGSAPHEPFFCVGAGPYEVVFWEHANYRGNCVTMKATYLGRGKYGDYFEPWIEQGGGSIFDNDSLSAVSVGSRVRLEVFNHANFGESFGSWAPGTQVPWVGDYANDKVSSFKIRVVE